jgi:endonuclease YncB( thermonuclease family)
VLLPKMGVMTKIAIVGLAPLVLAATPVAEARGPVAQSAAVCADYSNQADAQRAKDTRDADGDGIYCEALPCPCLRPGDEGGGGGGGGSDKPKPKLKPKPKPKVKPVTRLSGRIIEVVDGDTIKLRANGKTYTTRLIGIDTPEMKKPGTGIECGGREATSNMLRLSFTGPRDTDGDGLYDKRGGRGRSAKLLGDSTQDHRDVYGRWLGYVTTSAGRNLAVEQLAAGWSDVYVFEKRFAEYSRFRSVRNRAKDRGRGAWTRCRGDFDRPVSADGIYFFNARAGYLVTPETLHFCSSGCDYSGLQWSGWNTSMATASGYWAPETSGEDPDAVPVTITLSEPATCRNGVRIYTIWTETFPGDLPYSGVERTTTVRWRCDGQPPEGIP